MDSFLFIPQFTVRLIVLAIVITLGFSNASGQSKSIDGKDFSPYQPGAFKPKRGLFYTIYLSPVPTSKKIWSLIFGFGDVNFRINIS